MCDRICSLCWGKIDNLRITIELCTYTLYGTVQYGMPANCDTFKNRINIWTVLQFAGTPYCTVPYSVYVQSSTVILRLSIFPQHRLQIRSHMSRLGTAGDKYSWMNDTFYKDEFKWKVVLISISGKSMRYETLVTCATSKLSSLYSSHISNVKALIFNWAHNHWVESDLIFSSCNFSRASPHLLACNGEI